MNRQFAGIRSRHWDFGRCARKHSTSRPVQTRTASLSRSGASTMIKICGVTNPEDACIAADAGADFIGMIMWPQAKRSVSDETAQRIAKEAVQRGAIAVGVFVDEDAKTINSRCKLAGITTAQLHGDGARSSLEGIDKSLSVVWVLHATSKGEIVTPLPPYGKKTDGGEDDNGRRADWILIDGMQGGSGQALDWTRLQPPTSCCTRGGWMLAGGLKPENVMQAVSSAMPTIVDVSSGVCGPDGLKKDPERIRQFIRSVALA